MKKILLKIIKVLSIILLSIILVTVILYFIFISPVDNQVHVYTGLAKHEFHNSYKVKIPYEVIPLVPNKLGYKFKDYVQLYKQESNGSAFEFEYLDYSRIFKNNDFDNFYINLDDAFCVMSIYVYKEYKFHETDKLKHDIRSKFKNLKKFYGNNYNVYKTYNTK